MGIKDILIHLSEPGSASPVLEVGTRLASRYGAHLAGLHVYDLSGPLMQCGDYMDPATIQLFMDQMESAAQEKAARIQTDFEALLRRDGIEGEWRLIEGVVDATVTSHARYADLVLLGRSGKDRLDAMDAIDVESVLFGSGRPILLVPPVLAVPFSGSRILIGWNGSREASRAVADAMPLLKDAEEVRVLVLQQGDQPGNDIAAQDLARHLARHGVKVNASTASLGGLEAQDLILNTAADFGADLLVMGGYGHGRLREMVLGGVTRTLIRHCPVPVLMSH